MYYIELVPAIIYYTTVSLMISGLYSDKPMLRPPLACIRLRMLGFLKSDITLILLDIISHNCRILGCRNLPFHLS